MHDPAKFSYLIASPPHGDALVQWTLHQAAAKPRLAGLGKHPLLTDKMRGRLWLAPERPTHEKRARPISWGRPEQIDLFRSFRSFVLVSAHSPSEGRLAQRDAPLREKCVSPDMRSPLGCVPRSIMTKPDDTGTFPGGFSTNAVLMATVVR